MILTAQFSKVIVVFKCSYHYYHKETGSFLLW